MHIDAYEKVPRYFSFYVSSLLILISLILNNLIDGICHWQIIAFTSQIAYTIFLYKLNKIMH